MPDGEAKERLNPERLPTLPDKVVDNLRKGRNVPIEELAGPDAPAILDEARRRKEAPIHAENLTAISKEQAALMRNFNPSGAPDGNTMPNFPAQRRIIPAPFNRPSISLTTRPGDRRTWQTVRADKVREGEIVVDLGLVVSIVLRTRYEEIAGVRAATGFEVVLVGPEQALAYDPHELVRAFRHPEGDDVADETGAGPAPDRASESVS